MTRSTNSALLIGAYIAMVVVIIAVIVVLIYAFTGSWPNGAVIGGISGVVTVALYPVFFAKARPFGIRRHP